MRAFGSESMLEGVQAVVNQRMSEMATKMDATLEHLRVGAIKGQILDADGTAVIYDLFTEFGVTAHTEIDFDLDNASRRRGRSRRSAMTSAARSRTSWASCPTTTSMRCAGPTSTTT